MFILAHFKLIVMAILLAVPYYYFNGYLVKKIRPKESGKRLISFFITVFVTALIYSALLVFWYVWVMYK